MTQCDCKPGSGNETVLLIPNAVYVQTGRTTQTVSVDPCIAAVMYHLWENNVITLGCCCGHNKVNPSVVIKPNDCRAEYTSVVRGIIAQIDGRHWDIQAWRLVTL